MVKVSESTHSNLGKIEIAPEVLTIIASIATSEIKGIQGHFKELKHTSIENISKKQLSRGIKVDTREDGIYIDVYCTLSYGINISETAKKIQQAIYNSLTTMTTIEPSQINVHITHIEPIN
ncbi:Asp23/Gls24 family envelope stress response protein [Staphylococcus pseudoxylosus]|uniref:Asp23/Gls24 family envelope stress response protein n=1 Tax=Staphylococcus pseudoxylosus TaxID=2282419 RepID=A0AAQ0S7S4_9STAP|nr:Asp23/Gls24 family envelope stress response protein [Staphylococcus pseudoxylosus]PTI43258.1 Asp23/Gls24 family envelope stress response protein [Staphylococcus xylosus]MCE5002001.1 Asp23/Gls24 family envelope stress response protein [Staphylococcus pseudoxylosus]MDW8546853.1 Asp23/Gls24 family envelope stress response protein [Staphylococcus pseudoxylosus]MDW8798743.1 Asp23/Gls24 family envelope stress response protein [Staphylococcus pseudoxylosus]MEB5783779.1 Asp23/Gls24 family envelope 